MRGSFLAPGPTESASSPPRWGEVMTGTPGSPKPCFFPASLDYASLGKSAFQMSPAPHDHLFSSWPAGILFIGEILPD